MCAILLRLGALLLLTAAAEFAHAQSDYRLADLGFFNGPERPTALNLHSEAIGYRVVGMRRVGQLMVAVYRGYTWRDGLLLDLAPSANSFDSFPDDINDSGIIVGDVRLEDSSTRAAVLHADGAPADPLIVPNYTLISALSINNLGQVAGAAENASGARGAYRLDLRDGSFTDLGAFEGAPTIAIAINNAGTIVGQTSGAPTRVFLARPGEPLIALDDFLPADSPWVLQTAVDLNDSDLVLGAGLRNGQPSVFVFDPRGGADARELPPLPGDISATPAAINSRGIAVGYSYWHHPSLPIARWTAVRWDENGAIDLNTRIIDQPDNVWLSYAAAINDRGDIFSRGQVGVANHHFVLTAECVGDIDHSGAVDLQDLALLLSCFGVSTCGDLDLDNDTDLQDLARLLSNFAQCN